MQCVPVSPWSMFFQNSAHKVEKSKMYLATSRNGDNDKKPMRETLTYEIKDASLNSTTVTLFEISERNQTQSFCIPFQEIEVEDRTHFAIVNPRTAAPTVAVSPVQYIFPIQQSCCHGVALLNCRSRYRVGQRLSCGYGGPSAAPSIFVVFVIFFIFFFLFRSFVLTWYSSNLKLSGTVLFCVVLLYFY